MNTLEIICLIIAVLSIATAFILILHNRLKTKATMDKLHSMLDAAIDGHFSESTFDESKLSALEARLSRYLCECSVSSKNLLTEKNKIKALISDISHQTKTPIANILLYAQLLAEHELPEDCQTCVKALSAQAEKLNFLIGALVKTSRLESGIISVIPRLEQVQRLLDSATEQIKSSAEAKKITLSVQDSKETAYFDLKWTSEALYNIIDNAVKYTPTGGKIEIEVTAYELFCRIDVRDNGIGISEEEHSKIFARFYRSPSVSEEEGLGIGLFLAREILSAQGGYIKVDSRPGQGSTFSLFLPRSLEILQNC